MMRRSTRYMNARAQCSRTSPSVASLLTSTARRVAFSSTVIDVTSRAGHDSLERALPTAARPRWPALVATRTAGASRANLALEARCRSQRILVLPYDHQTPTRLPKQTSGLSVAAAVPFDEIAANALAQALLQALARRRRWRFAREHGDRLLGIDPIVLKIGIPSGGLCDLGRALRTSVESPDPVTPARRARRREAGEPRANLCSPLLPRHSRSFLVCPVPIRRRHVDRTPPALWHQAPPDAT